MHLPSLLYQLHTRSHCFFNMCDKVGGESLSSFTYSLPHSINSIATCLVHTTDITEVQAKHYY